MKKKSTSPRFPTTMPLIDRQRRLWSHAEAIEIAKTQGKPLPDDVSDWLIRAFQNIACGNDANEVFHVTAAQGVRKDGFLLEMQRKTTNAFIAAATEKGIEKITTAKAIEAISEASPAAKKSTIRKNWNGLSTDRKPTYTFGKK